MVHWLSLFILRQDRLPLLTLVRIAKALGTPYRLSAQVMQAGTVNERGNDRGDASETYVLLQCLPQYKNAMLCYAVLIQS